MPVIAPKRKMAQENFTEDENHKTVQELYCSAEFVRDVESKLIFLSALNIFFSSLHFWETFWFSDSSWYQYIGTALGLVTTIFAYAKIFVTLRHNQIYVQNHAAQGQPSQAIPLNIARYRKAVYSALWVQGTLVICYLPYSSSFETSERDVFIPLPCSAIYGYFSVFELIIKPVVVLLEDQRSKASCKSNIKATFLSIELAVFYAFHLLIPALIFCS